MGYYDNNEGRNHGAGERAGRSDGGRPTGRGDRGYRGHGGRRTEDGTRGDGGRRYGGGSRRGGNDGGSRGERGGRPQFRPKNGSAADLRELLWSVDHKSYSAYKALAGNYRFEFYELGIDHVQGDPFAAPSQVHVTLSAERAGFDASLRSTPETRRALEDLLTRHFFRASKKFDRSARGSGKSGAIVCSAPGQEILERSCCQFAEDGSLTFRFEVGFPAAGRTILAGELEKILFDQVPAIVEQSLCYASLNPEEVKQTVELAEDQTALRRGMAERGLVGFVADGAILPRESGISQKPMAGAIAFRSPEEDRVTFELPHVGAITGMGIRQGITLIIGGGYHGKSTLLQALERGVYDHIAGDGREFVLTDETAVKVRAEDGRAVRGVNISPFIRNLPSGKTTEDFVSDDASGSTSQAASCAEAIESGTRLLLMDEDTCATNFMVRDDLMQRIVSQDEEPIIPYSRTMRPMFTELGVSTILVAGSSGAFFPEADCVIQMDRYLPKDMTAPVRAILESGEFSGATGNGELAAPAGVMSATGADENASGATGNGKPGATGGTIFGDVSIFTNRIPRETRSLADARGRVKLKNLGRDGFLVNHDTVDLRAVEQICDREQTECLARLTLLAVERMDGKRALSAIVDSIYEELDSQGISAAVKGRLPGNLAIPRRQEFYAALNRYRVLKMK